jgi:hypothetical protein
MFDVEDAGVLVDALAFDHQRCGVRFFRNLGACQAGCRKRGSGKAGAGMPILAARLAVHRDHSRGISMLHTGTDRPDACLFRPAAPAGIVTRP